jgi:hypothetical protein
MVSTGILLDLADKFHGMDAARANAFGKSLGLDQGTVNLLERGKPVDLRADLEQLIYDMGHGSSAPMFTIERDMEGSQVWWLCERLCEQARLLEARFLGERGRYEESEAQS